jgi:adenine-specific DNA methylase
MIHTFKMYERTDLDKWDPWTGVLVRSMYSTTTRVTPMQLVFGRDTVINTRFIANWDEIRKQKQLLIEMNNQRENSKRIKYATKYLGPSE